MAQFGNGDYYGRNIDGQDISDYDDKTTALYNSIKSTEHSVADYGTGLYLVSYEMARTSYASGYYNTALKTAAGNYSSFGDSYSNSWLGYYASDPMSYSGPDNHALMVLSDGDTNRAIQSSSRVVAPAFNLDPSKVTLNGNAITVK